MGTQEERLPPKILCVDDESFVLDSLERVLRQDFQVLTADNCDHALELLKANTDTAIILTDFNMPKMSGIELLKQARLIAPNTVRAVLSGQIDLLQLSEAINQASIHRFIMKPWDNEYLRVQMLESVQAHEVLLEKNRLHTLAITDPITQLTNHRYFQERLKTEIKLAKDQKTELSLIMIDVDHFKSFNDHYRHPEGDRLLAAVSNRIQSFCPEGAVASRYGGEEFVMILPGTSIESAFDIAEELRLSLEKNSFAGPFDRPAYVTISLGLAHYPEHETEPSALIEAADRALYKAKRQGRNQTVVANK